MIDPRAFQPWLVMHTASVDSGGGQGHEGFTAFRRWKSREFKKPAGELGECARYTPAFSAERNKFDVRWVDGVWLGIRQKSGESIIGTQGAW